MVPMENNGVRYGISDVTAVPATRTSDVKSISCQNIPSHFFPSEASFSSYLRKTE